jgi:hypothetical protein
VKVVFIAYGPIDFASARMRCYWPAQYIRDAEVISYGDLLPDADVYIWQKNAHIAQIKERRDAQHWWDVCDPLHWFSPNESREAADAVDGIVASNQGLAQDLTTWAKRHVRVIPDRLELSHFPLQREHVDTKPVRFIWYGIAVNRSAMVGAWTNLARLAALDYKIELTVFDERPEIELKLGPEVPVYHKRWRLAQENAVIASHDIALLPPYPGPWSTVKSNNKELTAWACGLPSTTGVRWHDGFIELVDRASTRKAAGHGGRTAVEANHDVRQTAADWEELLCNT